MLSQIQGLHHVTSIASDPVTNNAFFTNALGLRRVKKTVNFDAPHVYHLYYGDGVGTPGSVMTYFPFPNASSGKRGTGEVGTTAFAIPVGTLGFWQDRLETFGTRGLKASAQFGQSRLDFEGPDKDQFALIETDDPRTPWDAGGVGKEQAIRGFHSASMRLNDQGATAELLKFMGYQTFDTDGGTTRFIREGGNHAHLIDIEMMPNTTSADQGAGSVHHIAFAVENRAAQLEVRKALLATGYQVTPVIDRDYFWAIYFHAPGGVLFEIATNEPGFDRDEDVAHLGETLRLPTRHEHLREQLETNLLTPIPN